MAISEEIAELTRLVGSATYGAEQVARRLKDAVPRLAGDTEAAEELADLCGVFAAKLTRALLGIVVQDGAVAQHAFDFARAEPPPAEPPKTVPLRLVRYGDVRKL